MSLDVCFCDASFCTHCFRRDKLVQPVQQRVICCLFFSGQIKTSLNIFLQHACVNGGNDLAGMNRALGRMSRDNSSHIYTSSDASGSV